VIQVDAEQGKALLNQHIIDVLINGTQVLSREDHKSQYAVHALKQYMEEEELQRIGNTYTESEAFPLRVGVNYLPASQAPGQNGAGGTPPATRPEETIIPSLTPPPSPFAHVLVAMIYILPITFISIFFTSSFMDEKINRRLTVLLSAPVTPFQIILGKMLPYATFALSAIALIAVLTKGNVLLTLAIFLPTTLFIFAIYLMVPLFYRTFKDTTFIAMLVTTLTTAYLVAPAMFTDVSDISFISPLTLAVKMYRHEPFGWREYLFPSLPMAAIFGFAMFAGTRLLNEEFLMGYKSITRKISDAIYLIMARANPYLSVPLWSLLVIPMVYMAQIVFLAFASNLPFGMILVVTLMASALMEEIAKSVGIVVLAEHGVVGESNREILLLSFLSALGFFVGEKLLVFLSISMVSQASISSVLFGAGLSLLVPLIAHSIFTTIVTLLKTKANLLYMAALMVGTMIHFLYNWYLLGGLR
jgi:ABC-type Na+ efflux pump permease subunit